MHEKQADEELKQKPAHASLIF